MKKIAVEKAQARLDRVREAYQRMDSSANFKDFEPAWVDFITALNTIHSVLEQGAKDSSQSRKWYGDKKHERRRDPLLRYIHQARNADEHGVEPIIQHDPGGLSIGRGHQTVHINSLVMEQGKIVQYDVTAADGTPILPEVILPHVKLVTVRDDRFGDQFDPPTQHLGNSLDGGSPLEVATIALKYHEELVGEAASIA